MTFDDARADMRDAYAGGAPGILASAIAWAIAGLVALGPVPRNAVLALFAGGVLIFPVSVVSCKLLGRRGAHAKTNPLGPLAMEATAPLLAGLPIAYLVSLDHLAWFFPAMLLVIGGRYFSFATLYGLALYRVLGGALCGAAFGLAFLRAGLPAGAFTGAAIEAAFAVVAWRAQRTSATPAAATAA